MQCTGSRRASPRARGPLTESVEDPGNSLNRGSAAWGRTLLSGKRDDERQDTERQAVAEPCDRAHRATSGRRLLATAIRRNYVAVTHARRRSVYRLGAGIRTADGAHSAAFCVTGSVAGGTPRDGQDTTGREAINAPYLAPRADFTGNFADSSIRPIRFSRPPPSTTRPSLRVGIRP